MVEIEEEVYSCPDPPYGTEPLWAFGSAGIVRVGGEVFASGIEVLAEVRPYNNNGRWLLFQRRTHGWDIVARGTGRTREPCPLAAFPEGTLFLSDNPALTGPDEASGHTRPEIVVFSASDARTPQAVLAPQWQAKPVFTQWSYRSLATDAENKELILIHLAHKAPGAKEVHKTWSFRDRSGNWSAQGDLTWPWGAEYPTPQPIRVCYPTVALKNRKVYFCGVSDISEPYPEWREHKKQITGLDWDYDFRRLFFTWSDDITTGKFHEWVEISSRDKTCGWINPCDLWVATDGAVHLLWREKAIDERLRDKFFPGEKQNIALMYAIVRDGKVVLKRPIISSEEEASPEVPGFGRFHITEDGRLFVFYSMCIPGPWPLGCGEATENRLVEILPDGGQAQSRVVPLQRPFAKFFTATWRAGSTPSNLLDIYGTPDIYGTRPGAGTRMQYARIRIK